MVWLSLCAEGKQWQISIILLILMAFMQVTEEGSVPCAALPAEDSACWPGQL